MHTWRRLAVWSSSASLPRPIPLHTLAPGPSSGAPRWDAAVAGGAQDRSVPGQPCTHSGWGWLCCPFPSLSLVPSPVLAEGSVRTPHPQLSRPNASELGWLQRRELGCCVLCPSTCAGSICRPLLHRGRLSPRLQRRCCSSYESVNGLAFQIFFPPVFSFFSFFLFYFLVFFLLVDIYWIFFFCYCC